MPTDDPYRDIVRRACLPEILVVPDDVRQLVFPGATADEIERCVLAGELGTYSRIAGRLVIRRDGLLAALEARELAQRGPA